MPFDWRPAGRAYLVIAVERRTRESAWQPRTVLGLETADGSMRCQGREELGAEETGQTGRRSVSATDIPLCTAENDMAHMNECPFATHREDISRKTCRRLRFGGVRLA